MSRAGEGKNESSAGRRVIVAKGRERAGQGRAEGARCHWGWILAGCNWVVAITAACGPCENNQVLLSKVSRRRRAEVGRYCGANIKASGRTAEVIWRWRSGWQVG